MPPRQRALTIVLSFPAPRTNWSCTATHGLASGPSARRTGAGQPCRVRRSARGYPRVRHSYQTLRIGGDMRAFGRRRMLCPSRWVIPGLAAGVTGWSADQRVPTAAGLRAAGRRACRFDSAGPGCRRDGWPGCCGQLRGGGTGLGHPTILSRAALAHDLRAGPDPQSAPNPASRRMVVPIQQRAQVEVGSRCSTFARTVIAKRC